MNLTASKYIDQLDLIKHPEGGYFKEVYRSNEFISSECLPERFNGKRCFATSIYFLLHDKEFSSFHRIKSDETWHFYDGKPVIIHILNEKGYNKIIIGQDSPFQYTVPKESWFAAELSKTGSFALLGCTVAPGFDFNDFELASKESLAGMFPEQIELINRMTKI